MLLILLMVLIGWVILLPAVVVGALYLNSRRHLRVVGSYDDLLADESEPVPAMEITPEAITGVLSPASRSTTRSAPSNPDTAESAAVGAGH